MNYSSHSTQRILTTVVESALSKAAEGDFCWATTRHILRGARRHSARRDRSPSHRFERLLCTACLVELSQQGDTSSQVHSAAWYPASLRYLL
jgi:hypothetical protein